MLAIHWSSALCEQIEISESPCLAHREGNSSRNQNDKTRRRISLSRKNQGQPGGFCAGGLNR